MKKSLTFTILFCIMPSMKLNTEKILKELARIDRSQTWLADKVGISRALMSYRLKKGALVGVEDVARVLDYDPKDLIRTDD